MIFPFKFYKREYCNFTNYVDNFNIEYKLLKNRCLCSQDTIQDLHIATNDILGVEINSYLCKRCSLLRLDKVMSENSLEKFYKNHYVNLYINSQPIDEKQFNILINDESRSIRFFNLIKNNNIYNDIQNVFEVGCGLGQNLWPFLEDSKTVSGCDYGEEYLEFGKSKGLNLYFGSINHQFTKIKSQDLVILSHIVEHIPNPIKFINDAVELLDDEKYILIEVPGIQNNKKSTLITSFQIPHIYTYNKLVFEKILLQLGLNIIYIDDEITVIVQKPLGWKRKDIKYIDSSGLEHKYKPILRHLKKYYIKYFITYNINKFLKILKLKNLIRKIWSK